MSSIDRMLIKGIRSFSPDNKTVIEFYKPLTLIVGHNGAGKTTIIECLKMACTGELPPNTRSGQYFVHDPKVAGETEVKAQIKLRFWNSQAVPFIVVRSFQLAQKKAGLTFKALDNALQTLDPDDATKLVALPYRCADINANVPLFMGATKAVLESVVFVHQEDANWPLAETRVLKSRFDDIFAATRYTKALDELRKLRARAAQEAKEMRLRLETVKARREHARRLAGDAAAGAARAAALEAEIRRLEGEGAGVAAARAAIAARLGALADHGEEIHAARARHEMLAAKNAETHARLVAAYAAADLDMGLEELEALAAEASAGGGAGGVEAARLEREAAGAALEAEALREERDRAGKAHSRAAAEADAHARAGEERDAFLRRACAEAGAAPPAGDAGAGRMAPELAAGFAAALRARADCAAAALEAARARHRGEDDARGAAVDAVAAELANALEATRSKQEQMRAGGARQAQLQAQLDALPGDGGAVEAARARERGAEARLAAKEADAAASPAEEEARAAAAAVRGLGAKFDALRGERAALAAAADEAVRLNYKATELAEAEARAAALLGQRRSALALALGVVPAALPAPGPELFAAVRLAAEARAAEAAAAAGKLRDARGAAAAAHGELEATRGQAARVREELDRLSAQLRAADGGAGGAGAAAGGVAARLAAAEAERSDKSEKVGKSEVAEKMMGQQASKARTTCACETCERPFSSPAEAEAAAARIEAKRKALPGMVASLKAQLVELAARVAALRLLAPSAARHDALRDAELPALEARVAALEAAAGAAAAAADAAARADADAATAAAEARAALDDAAAPLARVAADVAARRGELASLRAAARVGDASRSVADADSDLAAAEEERASIEAVRDAAAARAARLRDDVAALRSELHAAREDCLRLAAAAERRAHLEAQLAEGVAAADALATALVEGRAAAAPLEARRAEAARARDAARAAARLDEARLDGALRELQAHTAELDARERSLAEFAARGGAAELERTEGRLAELRRRHNEAQERVRAARAEAERRRAEAEAQAAHDRQVADILSFRRSKAQEAALAGELDAAAAALAAAGDRAALAAQHADAEAAEAAFRSEADRSRGALGAAAEAAARARVELADAQYAGVEERHAALSIELKTTEMAAADLERYHKALERALLAHHTTKMADINRVVRELWQKTYRGTDIDYIAIRADAEGGAARSYNYRVVMAVGGAELDMRGRCSAGQKVLACLVTRLALAEVFCLGCGVLALDEPTTNLDADNAASLAGALRALMDARRGQENFQLVVITHDEAFARAIGTREHAEFMHRLVKDEHQHSKVLKERIEE